MKVEILMEELMKKKTYKYHLLLMTLIFLLMSTGCSGGSSSQSYTLVDQMEAAKVGEDNELERIKIEKREEFDKMYADELYLEDFVEIETEFINEYSDYVEKMLSNSDMPFAYELKIQFYNRSLNNAKEGDLELEDIINNPGEHIRYIDLDVSFFRESDNELKSQLEPVYEDLKAYWDENNTAGVIENEILWSVYAESVLEELYLKDIQNESNHLFILDSYKKCLSRNILSKNGLDSYALGLDTTQDELDHLAEEAHKKYKEDFIGIIDLKDKGPSMCAPSNDRTLAFETDGEGADKYITLLVQKAIQELVGEILIEVGLDDVVVPIIVPTDRGIPQITKQKVDYPQQLTNEVIINDYFFNYTTITLYYLIDDLNDIDHDKLQDFYLILDPLFIVRKKHGDIEVKNLNCFVYYFSDSNSKVRKIYNEEIIDIEKNARYFPGKLDVGNLASAMYVTDDNSELSTLIKAYTKKENQISDLCILSVFDGKLETKKIIEHTVKDNIYGY